MKKILISLSFFIITSTTLANSLEFFGSGAETASVTGMATMDISNPENNFYNPAMLAFSNRLSISMGTATVIHNIQEINNIVINNDVYSNDGEELGDANTDYKNNYSSYLNGFLPLKVLKQTGVSFSLGVPVGHVMETNTGHPFLPEYIMYRSRYKRPHSYLNLVHALNSNWAVSLGTLVGFQVTADMGASASINNNGLGSFANSKTKIVPSLGAIISFAYNNENLLSYFTYTQEMKSNFEANFIGEIVDPLPIPFDMKIGSLMSFDPHTFKVGLNFKIPSFHFFSLLEYQLWSNYATPIARLEQVSGVQGSDDHEEIKLRNIFIPKLGVKYIATNNLSINTGVSYRQTPLSGDFSGSGNSIDTDKFIIGLGINYKIKAFNYDCNLLLSSQYHHLIEKSIVKTDLLENGQAGRKIGSGGYKIGGNIISTMVGFNLIL